MTDGSFPTKGIEHRVISTAVQASRFTEMSATQILSQVDEYNAIRAAAGRPEWIEAKLNVFASTWESYVRRLTHEAAPSGFMVEGLNKYLAAGWEAWISVCAFYCARFSMWETRTFIPPSSLIVLLRAVIEPQHDTLIKGAKAEAEAAVSTQIGFAL